MKYQKIAQEENLFQTEILMSILFSIYEGSQLTLTHFQENQED